MHRGVARAGRNLLIVALLLGGTAAEAQEGWDLHTFTPGAGALGVFHTQPTRTLTPWATNFGLTSDLAINSLKGRVGDEVKTVYVHQTWDLHLQGRLGLPANLELDLTLPLRLAGDAIHPESGAELAGFSPGDLNLALRWQARHMLGGGLGFQLWLGAPTGDPGEFSGDDGFSAGGAALLDGRVRLLHWAVNLGYRYRPEVTVLDATMASELYYALGADLLLPKRGVLGTRGIYLGFELFGATAASDLAFKSQQSPIEAVLGATAVWQRCRFGLGLGQGWQAGVGTPDARVLGRLTCGAQDEDQDGDGWLDPLDPCPAVAEDGRGPQDGCPTPDRDGDGLPDAADRCPDDPEDRDQFEDEDGCPDPDDDRDGRCDPWVAEQQAGARYQSVCQATDRCPREAEDRDGFQDEDGCPDPDNDQDQVPDGQDRCPLEAEDRDGFQDADGCPDPDNDGDGIPDGQDRCPNEPETYNGNQDDDGCPDGAVLAQIEAEKIEIKEVVYFKTASAELDPRSHLLLQAVAGIMKKFTDIKRIRVEGHTDDRNTDEYNLKLSRARAQSVMQYLVSQGVEEARLAAEGYGEGRPGVPVAALQDELKTAKGPRRAELNRLIDEARAKNRRVEFLILERQAPGGSK